MERGWKPIVSAEVCRQFNLLHEVVAAWQSPDLLIYEEEGI